jgi:hypothetical protein
MRYCHAFPLHKDYMVGNMFSVIPALLVGMPGVNWLPNDLFLQKPIFYSLIEFSMIKYT